MDIFSSLMPDFSKLLESDFMKGTSPVFGLSWAALFTYYLMFRSKISKVIGIILSLVNIAIVGGILYLIYTNKDFLMSLIPK